MGNYRVACITCKYWSDSLLSIIHCFTIHWLILIQFNSNIKKRWKFIKHSAPPWPSRPTYYKVFSSCSRAFNAIRRHCFGAEVNEDPDLRCFKIGVLLWCLRFSWFWCWRFRDGLAFDVGCCSLWWIGICNNVWWSSPHFWHKLVDVQRIVLWDRAKQLKQYPCLRVARCRWETFIAKNFLQCLSGWNFSQTRHLCILGSLGALSNKNSNIKILYVIQKEKCKFGISFA